MKNLKNVLKSKRVQTGKKTVIDNYNNYLKSREKSQEGVDIDALKQQLKDIKKYSIQNLDKLKKKAIKNLKEQNIQVFEAKDAKEARKIALKLIPKGKKVVKSKSNVVNEIGLEKILLEKTKFTETDCGDFIIQITGEEESHPVSPAIHIPLEKITAICFCKFGFF
jgi:L-lactate dehydrogenase complex protein LldG